MSPVDIAPSRASTEHLAFAIQSAASTAPTAPAAKAAGHDRGLLLIGLFKLSKSILFFAVGIGALHLLHKDLGNEAMRLVTALRRDPEGRLVTILMEKVELINAHRLKLIGLGSFAYSALALVEGWGLTMEKSWAEYLTLTLTVMFLPWELYELARNASWFRLALLVTNLVVLAYLILLLRHKRQAREQH